MEKAGENKEIVHGILISGGGTTMSEIIKAEQRGEIPNTRTGCIIASKDNIGGIEKARKLGIPEKDIVVVNPNDFRNKKTKRIDRDAFGQRLIDELGERGVSLVTQNGWMPLTPENVIKEYLGRIFNQHPGPVPEFGGQGMYGRRPHQAIIEFSRLTGRADLWTEVIGQRVGLQYDAGTVVSSEKVFFDLNDNGDTLQQRALPVEHNVQIKMVKDFVLNSLNEIKTREPIVLPGQEEYLEEAKKIAKELYPTG